MSKELTKKLMCICMRGGVEVWIEADKIDNFMQFLETKKFTRIGNQIINSADVTGVFDAKTMEEKTMLKNGYWKCQKANYWHRRYEICGH